MTRLINTRKILVFGTVSRNNWIKRAQIVENSLLFIIMSIIEKVIE